MLKATSTLLVLGTLISVLQGCKTRGFDSESAAMSNTSSQTNSESASKIPLAVIISGN